MKQQTNDSSSNSFFRGAGGLTDLILMICKNHHGEWLTARRVRDIVNAIKGTNVQLVKIRRGLNKLTKTNKLTRMTDTNGEHYTANCTKGGFYL